MKLLWTGSDVLFATRLIGGKKFPTKKSKFIYFLGMTIFAKIADLFVQEHYVVSEHLIKELKPLKLKKKIKILIDPPRDINVRRTKHDFLNVLYYNPHSNNKKFTNWLYGRDIITEVMFHYVNNNRIFFWEANGSDDPEDFYRFCDFYLRPNRHDGEPRMIMECKQLGIPYYWSRENPDINEIINKIDEVFSKTQSKV